MDTTRTGTPIDGQAELAEAWRDIFAAKIGHAQMLTLRVIFKYSFALNRAAAWIPDLGVFKNHTGIAEKETGEVLAQLESYQMLEWRKAPLLNVLPKQYPHGRLYLYFPRRTRAWSIAPRVPNRQLVNEAAMIDRWLLAFNAGGGAETADLFAELWTHADTLAETPQRSAEPPLVCPDMRATQSVQTPIFARPAESAEPPLVCPDREVTTSHGAETSWGKTPRDLGEKPQGPPFNDLNERQVSHLNAGHLNERRLGKNPKRRATELDPRKPHWPPLETERALMRQLNVLVDRYYAPEVAVKVKDEFGGCWRCRIRKFAFGVKQAMFIAEAQWSEMTDLGTFLNLHYNRLLTVREQRAAEMHRTESAEELDPATVRAEIVKSLGGGET